MTKQTNKLKDKSYKILIGLLVGAVIGIIFNMWGNNPIREMILANVTIPIGTAFLRALVMIVVPLVFSSLVVGVTQLGSAEHVGRLGFKIILFYLATTLLAVLIGQVLINTIAPGANVSETYQQEIISTMSHQVSSLQSKSEMVNQSLWPGLVDTVIPKNIIRALSEGNMLAIIFISILLGLTLLTVDPNKSKTVITFFDAIQDACITIVGWIMKTAPYAVAALIITAVSQFGVEVMKNVLLYVVVVLTGYFIHFFISYSLIVKYVLKIPVQEFYKRIVPIIGTAFSTSSSSATMPTTIRTLETRFGIPSSIATFSIPLGTTINMDGTALFEIIAILFIGQVFGIDISIMGQVTLVVIVLLTSIGVAGVPGGSIPILMSAMASLGIPAEGIALVLGVDRLLDMGRTVINVTGDSVGTLFLAKTEGIDLNKAMTLKENE